MKKVDTSEIVETIIRGIDPEKIILFGSRATGTDHEFSDIDLLIIKDTKEPKYQRARIIRELFHPQPCAMDILVYTPEEYKHLLQFKSLIPYIATQEGKVMYERGN